MVESGKVSSSVPKVKTSGTLMSSAIQNIPPALRRFERFIKDMAQKFSRHLAKDRTKEFIEAVIKGYRDHV
ncbi:MAG: hypothetical protein NTZ10_02405 [Candidatus Saganbacteria bacterium]|nr:hypothetical protein [Candidatus Saganbacteria bacterium]